MPALRRAATRGDGWLPQGPPADGMTRAIEILTAERERAGRTGRFDIGGAAKPLYVGTPTWDIGDNAVAGDPQELADTIREWVLPGVTYLQIRFRCRSADELVDQIAVFGAEVIPLVRT
jgi:alkanesulfonate monooxygenase SsuD/methylene tetrahydromethanopterin reductase-like flavin-dependent oxidoreductase (luciferase family)